ncbi:MAG: hypothetical protein KDD45_05030 [Bdellovibrionales bacterium]|nr:hypothetical protein [Bdellovibrionales bacterium]
MYKYLVTIIVFSLAACTSDPSLPQYKILDKLTEIDGTKYCEILIESYSRETPKEEIEATLEKLIQKLNVDKIALYCSEEAKLADFSESYRNTHPEAVKCILGLYQDHGLVAPAY